MPPSLRDQKNEYLLKHIKQVHADSRETYGSLRVHAELTLGGGLLVSGSPDSCARPASRASTGADAAAAPCATRPPIPARTWSRASSPLTSRTGHGSPISPSTPLQKARYSARPSWTPIPGSSSTGPLSNICAPNSSPTRSPVAIIRRQPDKRSGDDRTILHADHGCQDTSWAFRQRLRAAGLLASMGTVGDCDDNARMESFWGTMKLELLNTKSWQTRDELANAIRRVDRMLVQPTKTPFQHRNAQPRHLRDPPHRARPRSLTPHRRWPCYGGNLSDDDTVRLWDTDPNEAAKNVCSLIVTHLTPTQWQQYVPDLPYRRPC